MESTSDKVLSALASYNLKKEGANGYRCNNPLRNGSDSMSFTLTINTPEKGAWYDHVAQEGGSLYELANHLGIEIPVALIPTTKRTYAGLKDYAESHGISAETLAAADWHEVEYKGRLALEFSTKTGKRWRFLDGKTPHYISPQGYKRCWYGLNVTTLQRIAQGQPLVIANGEISTVVGQAYGTAVACITGGENGIPPELMAELKAHLGDARPRVIIAGDCDDKGRRAAKLAESQFKSAGFEAVAIDMRLSKGGDLADFCMLHEENILGLLTSLPALPDVEIASEAPAFGWSLMHSKDLKHLPRVAWVIAKQIQAMGINVIYGQSGIGKSFLALHYALTVAQKSPVIYMAGEGVYGYEKRIAAWEIHHKQSRANLFICTGAVSLLETDELQHFLAQSQPIKPVLVIVDTLSRSMVGGDENSTRDMMLLIRACDQIKQGLGCAVLLVHHIGKGNKSEERGSSALRGAADVMIRVSAIGDDIAVDFSKVKDESPLPESYYRLLPVNLNETGDSSLVLIESERVIQSKEDSITRNQRKILVALRDIFVSGAFALEIADELGINRGGVQRTLSELVRLDFVAQSAPREPYTITDTGKNAIEDSKTHKTHENHEGDNESDSQNQKQQRLMSLMSPVQYD